MQMGVAVLEELNCLWVVNEMSFHFPCCSLTVVSFICFTRDKQSDGMLS